MRTLPTPKELVLKYCPNAHAVSRPTIKGGKYYNIMDDNSSLGQGNSKIAAWKAAWKNLNND